MTSAFSLNISDVKFRSPSARSFGGFCHGDLMCTQGLGGPSSSDRQVSLFCGHSHE